MSWPVLFTLCVERKFIATRNHAKINAVIGLAGTVSVPRRTVPVNAMMANSILMTARVAVPILSPIHVRGRPKSRSGEE